MIPAPPSKQEDRAEQFAGRGLSFSQSPSHSCSLGAAVLSWFWSCTGQASLLRVLSAPVSTEQIVPCYLSLKHHVQFLP